MTWVLAGLALMMALAAPPTALARTKIVPKQDGPRLNISQIKLQYHKDAPGLPNLDEIMNSAVVLGDGEDGLVSPTLKRKCPTRENPDRICHDLRPDVIPLKLSDIGKGRFQWVYASALGDITARVVEALNKRGIIGVFVRAHPQDLEQPEVLDVDKDLNEQVKDRRRNSRGPLRLEVWLARVTELRTIAQGERVDDPSVKTASARFNRWLPEWFTGRRIGVQERINAPLHSWIKEYAPVNAAPTTQQAVAIQKDTLDEYVLWLNQHPGRHVDVAVTSAAKEDPEAVILDYLVTEAKPWIVYAQLSNTGTEQTSEWRERFGYTNNQFSSKDDILSIDYVTAGFTESNAVTVSYDRPIRTWRWPWTRWRVYGVYDQFVASDVGQAAQNFEGDTQQLGLELIHPLYQKREFFLYGVVGARAERFYVDNTTAQDNAEAIYGVPYVGVRAERIAETDALVSDLTLLGGFTTANEDNLTTLGRSNPDTNFALIQANASYAFFLEPILNPREFFDVKGNLAAEIALSLKGQYAFGARLIPQEQQTAGGFYTVRGYPESVSAGDTVIVASAEFRYHIPRSFKPEPVPKQLKTFGSFRVAPQQFYGRPDWDLVPRVFIDVGRTLNNDRLFFERNDTLLSAGFGIELQIKQNFNLRLDWGIALLGIDEPDQSVDAGDSRVHVSFTILY